MNLSILRRPAVQVKGRGNAVMHNVITLKTYHYQASYSTQQKPFGLTHPSSCLSFIWRWVPPYVSSDGQPVYWVQTQSSLHVHIWCRRLLYASLWITAVLNSTLFYSILSIHNELFLDLWKSSQCVLRLMLCVKQSSCHVSHSSLVKDVL